MVDNSFGDEETRMPVDPAEKKDVLGSGDVLGDYRIVELLGRGGMGEVYRAENQVTGRQVALKVISREATRGADFVERFKLEARVMSDLEHPGIVRVHHAGEAGGRFYLTMDLVEGGTLEEYLDKGEGIKDNGGEDQVRDIAIQICEALAYAHGKGIVHRDLKPGNIMLAHAVGGEQGAGGREGGFRVKITDFGLAKAVGEEFVSAMVKQSISLSMGRSIGEVETRVGSSKRAAYEGTSTGAILGTYDYMSPEQKVGAEVTKQSDLYSFGVILYKLLTGRKPVGRAKPVSFYGVDASWDPIVDKLLEEEFLERYGSAEEVLEDLRLLGHGGTGKGRGAGSRGKKVVGVLVVGCLLLVGGWFGLESGLWGLTGQTSPTGLTEEAGVVEASEPTPIPTIVPAAGVERLEQRFVIKPEGVRMAVFGGRGLVVNTNVTGEVSVELTAGRYEVELQKDGYEFLKSAITVDEAGGEHTFELVPLRGELSLRTTPGASVTAVREGSGERVGLGKADDEGTVRYGRLVEGRYRLEIAHTDYETRTETVEIRKDREAGLVAMLTGKPGWAWINASPAGEVWLDGKPIGQTGRQIKELSAGSHRFEVRARGYRTERLDLEVPANGSVRHSLGNLVRENGSVKVVLQVPGYAQAYFRRTETEVTIGSEVRKLREGEMELVEEGLEVGGVQVRVESSSFKVVSAQNVVVRDGETTEVRFWLEPLPARVVIVGVPVGAKVSVVGGVVTVDLVGTVDEVEVPSLRASELVVSAVGYESARIKVPVLKPGEKREIRVVLPVLKLGEKRAIREVFEQQKLPKDLVVMEGAKLVALAGLATGSREARERQVAESGKVGLPLEVKSAKLGMVFRYVPSGEFLMGSPKIEQDAIVKAGVKRAWVDDEDPQTRVTLGRGMYVGKYEVTQEEWERVMGSTPSHFKNAGKRAPVEQVSWEDCQAFVKKLCALEGVPEGTYRLLTEAEWEYACRAGTETALYTGGLTIRGQKNGPELDGIAWYGGNSGVKYKGAIDSSGWSEKQYNHTRAGTHPVGAKMANGWGLHDMIGNVWEWTGSVYGKYPGGSRMDYPGLLSGPGRVFRGGGWDGQVRFCRSAVRGWDTPGGRLNNLGLRLMRVIP